MQGQLKRFLLAYLQFTFCMERLEANNNG